MSRKRSASADDLPSSAPKHKPVERDLFVQPLCIITVSRTILYDDISLRYFKRSLNDSLHHLATLVPPTSSRPRYFFRNSTLNMNPEEFGKVYQVQTEAFGTWLFVTDVAELLHLFSEVKDSSSTLEQLGVINGVIPSLLIIDESKLQYWHVQLPISISVTPSASGRAKSGELIRKDHAVIHDGHHILDLDDHYYLHPVLSTKAVAVFCDEILSNSFDPSLLQLAHRMIDILVAPLGVELPDIQILKANHHVSDDNSKVFPIISAIEVKQIYSVGDERHQNSIYYLKRFYVFPQKNEQILLNKKLFFKRSVLNLGFRGPKLEVCADVLQNKNPIIEPLFSWDFSSNFQFGHAKSLRNLLIFLTAFRNYVQNVLEWEPETTDEFELQRRIFSRTNFLPFISSCPSFEGGSELLFKICGQIKRNVFWALMRVSDEEEKVVIVSITTSYCYEAHYFLSTLEVSELASGQTSSFAPKLLGGQRLADFYVVVMEHLNYNYSAITKKPPVEKCIVLKSVLETLLKHFHAQNMVHGDFRGSNIFKNEHNFVKIIDFEWSGRSGAELQFSDKVEEFSSRVLKPLKLDCPMQVPTYSLIINEQIKWPDGVAGGVEIKQQHDLANLCYFLGSEPTDEAVFGTPSKKRLDCTR
ncbi:hypothetical protein RCL1_009032 [Eukaryota sp. TZLM3-RCL]